MSEPSIPAIDPIEQTIPGVFDEHKTKIIAGCIAVIALIFVGGAIQFAGQKSKSAVETEFAQASTAEDYRALIDKESKNTIGGNARLLLAEALRGEGKNDEAIETLQAFLANNRDHALSGVAMLSLAGTYHETGDNQKALQTYRQIPAQMSESFAAPLAMLAEASILIDSGNTDDARTLLENIIVQFPDQTAAQQASMDLQRLPAAPLEEAIEVVEVVEEAAPAPAE